MKLVATNQIDWVTSQSFPELQEPTVYFGAGSISLAMQIAAGKTQSIPSRALLKKLYLDRKGKNAATNLMVVIEFGSESAIYGPDPDSEVLLQKSTNTENFLNSVLAQENGIYAYQRAVSLRRSLQTTDMVGFTNNGLFASHYIRSSAATHPKWKEAQALSLRLQNLRGRELISALGFEITASPSNTLLLSAQGQDKRVVAILLDQSESFDSKSTRFQASPVEWGLSIAQQQSAPWVIAIRDSQVRLYPAKDGVGVGQKSQVETYFEIDLLTIDEDKAGLMALVFSSEALCEGGTADELLVNSQKFASELGVRLRERVYESIVPALATEIANQLRTKGFELDAKGLQRAYELTLRVLFRLLFQAYAEDRGLLPSGRNEIFDSNSMKHWGDHLLKRDSALAFGDSSSIWFDMMQVWDAIDQGNPDMQIPAYNGGLFGTDQELHPDGYLIRSLSIPDRVMGPALRALVIDDNTEDGVAGAVDFRSLSVREFGTIYEGLLESSLSVADQDLTVDKKGAWVPAKDGDQVIARANEVYFHSASGERKATGSYYTPSFIVDHLIERSVEPALNDHLAKVKLKLEADDQAGAYADFFDFRVADLAMGSAHFLVAAIDKIETVMRSFLIQEGNQIDGVNAELLRLEAAAKAALGPDEAAYAEIERASLLRRQIARRCIYGLDINPLAVELSRLAIWIHTFVPGLPMSSLEHNLVCANSLTGIGSVEEGLNALIPDREKFGTSLFDGLVESSLQEAKTLLEDVASADEASKAEAKQAAQAAKQARQAAAKSKMIFDVAVANRNGVVSSSAALTESDLEDLAANDALVELIEAIQPAHMPYLFPEVFLRENPGFDALVGNPPWEKVKTEIHQWWGRHLPGIRSLQIAERNGLIESLSQSRPDLNALFEKDLQGTKLFRRALLSGPFPGLGSGGDPDLYQAFMWRFLDMTRDLGRMSIIVPRGAFSGPGMAKWRISVLSKYSISSLVMAANTSRWMFEGVHSQYTVALASVHKELGESTQLAGPISSRAQLSNLHSNMIQLEVAQLKDWSDTFAIPVFESVKSLEIMKKMASHPKFGEDRNDLDFRLVYELHSSADADKFDTNLASPAGVVPVLKGASIHFWNCQFGPPYGFAEEASIRQFMAARSAAGVNQPRSAYFGLDRFLHVNPLDEPKIVFRSITNRTNSRTLICALVPANCTSTDSAPTIVRGNSSVTEEAYILGIFSTRVFDWYVRRWAELKITLDLMRRLPLPIFDESDSVHKDISLLAACLVSTHDGLMDWSQKVIGDSGKGRIEGNVERLKIELEARVARSFGLTDEDLREVFSTFQVGWNYESELADVQSALRATQ
jgi:hypothetical protein